MTIAQLVLLAPGEGREVSILGNRYTFIKRSRRIPAAHLRSGRPSRRQERVDRRHG
jgi:hypothetical protein